MGCLIAENSRYVIDLNRDPAGAVLYPGQDNTELCPTSTFERHPIYAEGAAPDGAETARRVEAYWRPYHRRLSEELAALRDRFGIAVLFDARSIRSVVPRFFAGRLPDFNLGTGGGTSADPRLAARLMTVLGSADGCSAVLDGRFKGGFITRHYGRPQESIHAVQLELSQITYMDEDAPFAYRDDLACQVQPVLQQFVATLVEWAWENADPELAAISRPRIPRES